MKVTRYEHSTNKNIAVEIETDKYNDHYIKMMNNGYQWNGLTIKDKESAELIIAALREHFDIPPDFVHMVAC